MPDYADDQFEWDIDKSDETERRRHFNFAFAAQLFLSDNYIEGIDDRHDYDEERYKAIGPIEGILFSVVYVVRGKRRRIVAAWKSDDKEQNEYAKAFPT
ncbi:MAG: BrnT family toxin [Candidatus Aquilonibacter sp.]